VSVFSRKTCTAAVVITLVALLPSGGKAQSTDSMLTAAEQEIVATEKAFNAAIQAQDSVRLSTMLGDSYFLAVGVQGRPLQVVPKAAWLQNLKYYRIHSYSIDEIKVNVYGNTAVALMLLTQHATVGRVPRDRSAQFYITDIWVRQQTGWRIMERHSSRPEPPPS
jgi:ketosteroid isomerase-like protein